MPASFNDLLADDLHPGDVIFIDDVPHRFLKKEPGGAHKFFVPHDDKVVGFDTATLLNLQVQNRYYRPGHDRPSFGSDDNRQQYDEERAERLKKALTAFRAGPRARANAKWRYVARFLDEMRRAQANGTRFSRVKENAERVRDAEDAEIDRINAAERDPARYIIKPKNRHWRTILRWVSRAIALNIDEAALIHKNAVRPHRRRVSREALEILATTIRKMVPISPTIGPKAIYIQTKLEIEAYNREHNTSIVPPSHSTVQNEWRRYDAWVRLAAARGRQAADAEYGTFGTLQRPSRILDLVEIDHHKFDLHATFGSTPSGSAVSSAGLDRFWLCMALDVHSNYPLGFAITFEPGGLLPALMCIDHAIRPKTYVRERWPDIDGDLLGYGKPVRVRYDNAKEFVGVQMQAALARLGIGYELAVPGVPQSKPYVERLFGTIERDFVAWLPGATGSNPKERGDRRPLKEARISCEDFIHLFHKYLIEVYARRPQQALDGDTPEQRWMRGASSHKHRPRMLTANESGKLDYIVSAELEVKVGKKGFVWRGLTYNSESLQRLRRVSGFSGRTPKSTIMRVRIPLKDISRAYVANPRAQFDPDIDPSEIEVWCTNPAVRNRTVWQHEIVRQHLKRTGQRDTIEAYERSSRLMFRAALETMAVTVPGAPAGKATLTGGAAPRSLGAFLDSPFEHALKRTEDALRALNWPRSDEIDGPLRDTGDGLVEELSAVDSDNDEMAVAPPRPPLIDQAREASHIQSPSAVASTETPPVSPDDADDPIPTLRRENAP